MAASGACSLAIGLLFGTSPWILPPPPGSEAIRSRRLGQFSALVTEVPPARRRHRAHPPASIGLLTNVTIHLVPELVEAFGWS